MASEPLIPCPGCGRKESPDEPLGCLLARRIWRVTCGCGWQGPAELTEQRAIAAWSKRVPNRAVEAVKDCHGCTHIWTNGFGVSYCAFRHGPINWRGCEHYLAVDAIRKEAADGEAK